MSPVWRAATAAVRRRRLQTTVIGIVVLFSTATIVVALALLDASSAPFDRAFDQQRGAHAVATFDPTVVPDGQLARTAAQPGIEAAAGPFGQTVLDVPDSGLRPGPLTVVGRADPAGPVDRVDLWNGRWATGPGEIVLDETPPYAGRPAPPLGETVAVSGGPALTVVGYAYSVSRTADAWVAPAQMAALHPTATQMLYRFHDAATSAEIGAGLDSVAAELPPGSLVASQPYLVIKQAVAAGPGVYVPFLLVFGVLGLVVAILIVANVVSGAVVSGFRHIGILKALGFTPRQVVAVYLVMVSVPAVAGCLLGTVLGDLAARPLLSSAFQGLGFGGDVGASLWVDIAALLGMPGIVILAALVPALRAHRLSAAEAISAGSAPRTGRGLRSQRWLSGTRLPRAVSLGLGLPFARPGRTALTMAAVVLGVTTVAFATGLVTTVTRYDEAASREDAFQVTVLPGQPRAGQVESSLTDPETEALLRSLPGTVHVTADLAMELSLVGYIEGVDTHFLRGDAATLGYQIVEGRWLAGPGEVVAPSALLRQRGLAVGDQLTLDLAGGQTTVTVVGKLMAGGPGPDGLFADWQTLTLLAPGYRAANDQVHYHVQLTPDTDVNGYVAAVRSAGPGLYPVTNTGTYSFTVAMVSLATLLTLMLGAVAALGVFNTAVLNTRERRRDLGMLKSIGMTPGQVVAMVVTSMAVLGALGGLLGIPLGMLAHRLIVPVAAGAAQVDIPESLLQVWQAPLLGLLALAGVAIAVLGAFIPARSAARLTIAEALHNE